MFAEGFSIKSKGLDTNEAVSQEEAEPSSWDVDRAKYDAAQANMRALGHTFFIILGFFVAVTGWFISLKPSIDVNRPFFGLVIGVVFFLLLMFLAKQHRLMADNLALVKKIERRYRTKNKLRLSGPRGIADFISFIILSSTTAYFLLYPHRDRIDFHEPRGVLAYVFIVAAIMVVTHFILGDGLSGQFIINRFKLGRKLLAFLKRRIKTLQYLAYWGSFITLALYCYLSWF